MTTIEKFKKIYRTGYRHVILSVANDLDKLTLVTHTMTSHSTLQLLGIDKSSTVITHSQIEKFTRKDIFVVKASMRKLTNFTDLEQVIEFQSEFYHHHNRYELAFSCTLEHLLEMINTGALIVLDAFKEGKTYKALEDTKFKDNSYSLPDTYEYAAGSEFLCDTVWSTRFGDIFLKDSAKQSRCPLKGVYTAAGQSYSFYDKRYFKMV